MQAIYDGIDGLTMARYRPSAYRVDKQREAASEEALAGLMQSQLLKRFESSWYAALQTVRRMRDASEVLLHVITERGAVPPPEVIRDLAGCGKTLLSTQGRKLSDDKRRPIACSERIIRIGLSHAECRRDS